jgi:hypothetical protein
MATGYGLDDQDVGVRVMVGQGYSVLQIGSWVHPTSYPMGTGALSLGVKRPGREVGRSLPTSAEVKKMCIYTSTPPYAFMA